ncbi:MAG: hypothetical protein IKX25_06035 [Bacteroidales bacterium]|nr:hypothetical protein [Bacteroidales bacterium]
MAEVGNSHVPGVRVFCSRCPILPALGQSACKICNTSSLLLQFDDAVVHMPYVSRKASPSFMADPDTLHIEALRLTFLFCSGTEALQFLQAHAFE